MTAFQRAAILLIALSGISLSLLAVEPGDAERGKKLYMSVGCYACHGTIGQGSIFTGPRLAPDPIPLPAFEQLVRHPPNVMPPYSEKVLPDQDVADIHGYLSTIPASPPAEKVFQQDSVN